MRNLQALTALFATPSVEFLEGKTSSEQELTHRPLTHRELLGNLVLFCKDPPTSDFQKGYMFATICAIDDIHQEQAK